MNNDEEKVKAKARQIRDLYGKISSVFKEALKNAVYDEDSILYNTINQWIIKKELNRQQEAGAPFENSHENRESKTLSAVRIIMK
ncbi:hypothetical protein RIR_jg22597.t1 [Rhizophagus irregularis DAOM 181602=DAOM 197198]|nr:hypothetical protein RIR_jg22597.t1 [Rhizophagus irregularis DAOM 181602=DAOM 197198]